MPKLRNNETGQETFVPDTAAARLVGSGDWSLVGDDQVEVRSSVGGRVRVGGRQLQSDKGLKAVTGREQAEAIREDRLSEHTEGFWNKAKALGEGFASGATFGAADVLMDDEATRAREEFAGAYRTVGEIGGVVLPSLLAAIPTGGASVGAGAARVGAGIAAKALAKGAVRGAARWTPAGIAARVGGRIAGKGGIARAAAAGAAEGAMGNAGYYLSDVALGKRDLSAEGFVGAMGEGALWGGAAGGAFGATEAGLMRARKLFPRKAAVSKGAAETAQAEFDDVAEQALSASDEMVTNARALIKENRAKKAAAGLDLARAREAGDLAGVKAAQGEMRALRTKDAEARYIIEHGTLPPAPKPSALPDAPSSMPSAGDEALPPVPGVTDAPEALSLPPGFRRGPHVTDDAAIRKGVPEYSAIDEDGIYVVHPRDLMERGFASADGQAWSGDAVRLDKVRKGMSEGAEFDPLQFSVRPDGSLDVIDGRHRLVAAAELDRPVAVRFSRGVDDAKMSKLAALADELDRSKVDVRDWIASMKEKAGPQWVKRTPEGGAWSRGNADLGVDIVGPIPDEEIARRFPSFDGAEDVRLDYDEIIQRAAREQDEATRAALIRDAADLEEGAWDVTEAAFRDETRVARQRAGISAEDIARQRVDAAIGRMEKMSAQDLESFLAGTKPAPHVGKASKGDDAFRPWDAQMRATADQLPPVGQDTSEWLARMGIRNPQAAGRLTDEVEQGIEVMTAYERANAELAKELGDTAPAVAKAHGDEFDTAVNDRVTKASERTAQAADEAASAATPDPTVGKGKASKMKGKSKAPAAPAEGSDALGKAADLGALMEGLSMAGVNLGPDVDKIPIIGPLLGLYLKARAAKAVLGRLGGKIPATTEARAAGKAAQTRDRIASAVDRMLEGGSKAVGKAKGALARTAALGHTLFDDGVKRTGATNDVEAALHRIGELASAQANPERVRMAVRRKMRDAIDPSFVSAVEETVIRKLSYLAEHMPKEPPPSLLGRKPWQPSKTEVDRFARRVKAAENPASVFEDLADGTVTAEAAETLREVYPELYAEAQMRLIERAAEVTTDLPYQSVVKLSTLFTAPLTASMRPERIAAYQMAGKSQEQAGGPPAPPQTPTGPAPKLGKLFAPEADRRAM